MTNTLGAGWRCPRRNEIGCAQPAQLIIWLAEWSSCAVINILQNCYQHSQQEQHVIANEALFLRALFNLSIQMFSTSGSENVSLSSSNFNQQFWGQATAKLPKLWEGKPQQNKENMCSNKPMLNKNAFNCPCLSQLKTRPNICFSNTLGTCLSLAWPVADLPKAW